MTHVHPTQDDGVVAALSEVVGGPVGERAGRGRPFTVLGVLLALTALTFALGLVSKTACAVDDWSNDGGARYTHLCVSDVPGTYTDTGLVELTWPWQVDRDRSVRSDEPALVGLWSYAAARVTHLLTGSPDVSGRNDRPAGTVAASEEVATERSVFMAVNVVGFAVLALLATASLAAVRRRRPWDAAGFAAAPVLALAGVVSWDLIAVAAAAGALLAWSRGRPVPAGLLVGVGAAAGVWPVVLLGAFLLAGVRERRTDLVLPAAVTATAAWAVLNAPAFLTGRAEWEATWSALLDRGPDQGSLWTILDQTAGLSQSFGVRLTWSLVGLWFVGVVAVVLLAPVRARVSQVAVLLIAGVLVLGLTYQPSQALWLLPFAALARPRWRDLLIWQAGEVLYFAMLWWWLGGLLSPGSDGSAGFYWIAIVVRVLCTLWLVGVVVRDLLLPGQVTTTRSNEVAV